MRSGLTNPSPLKSNYVNFSGKLFNVILVKEERPPLQKSAAWLIESTDRARSPSSEYWRRYLASDCQSEWAARARRSLKFCEMQLHLIASA